MIAAFSIFVFVVLKSMWILVSARERYAAYKSKERTQCFFCVTVKQSENGKERERDRGKIRFCIAQSAGGMEKDFQKNSA